MEGKEGRLTMNFESVNRAKGVIAFSSPSLTPHSQKKHEEVMPVPLNIENMRNSKTDVNAEFLTLIECDLMKSLIFERCLFHG